MASLAEITLAVRDRASAEIAHVARELRTLPDTHSVNLRVQGGGGLGGHARDLDTITRHARTADGTLKSLGGTALSVASGLGFGLGAAELGQYVIGAGQAANQLSRTNEVTKILAGTTEEYRQVVALARQGQRDFGGSFDAQLAGLGGLIPLAREAGVELAYLDNISKRLNLKSPENGPGGARIALSEFLSGSGAESSLSLRERYEIPKEKIEHLTQPGVTNEEKLRGLDQILNQMRFNNEALTASTNLSAASWTRLGASVDNAKVKFGGMISEGLAPAAEAVGQLLSGFQGGSEQGVLRYAQASLSLVGAKRELTAAEKEQILGLAQWLGLVTPAVAAADAHTAATRASATETERHAALQNMAAVAGGQLASEELEIERATRAAAAATREAAAAFRKETADAASNEAQSRLAAQAKEALTNRATTAAKAILNSGNASTAAIGRMASLTGIGFGLLNMYVQVERAARAANAAMSGITGATDAYAQIYDRNGGRAGNKLVVEKGKAAAGVADAERDAIMATGTYAQKLALLNRELADLEKRAPKSEAAIRKRTERDSLVLSAPKGGKGSDPTKVGGLDDRLATAGKTDVAELAHWRTRIKGMEQGSNEWKAARAKILGLEERIANSDTRATLKAGKTAQRDAEDIRRREFALLDDPGKRRALQAEQATLPKGSLRAREIAAEIATINERIASQAKTAADARVREADQLLAAQRELMSNEERLISLSQELATSKLPEKERLDLQKQILDTEKKISDEQKSRAKAVVDLDLGRLDDAKKRREEERKATTARRVLSSNASDAAKVEAQAVLDRIPLEQASRAQDLADLMEKSGNGTPAAPTLSLTRPVGGIGRYGDMTAAVRELEQRHGDTAKAADPDLLLRLLEQRERRESFTTPALPLLPPGGSGAGGASGQQIVVNITAVLPDGSTVRGTTTATVARGNTIADMRLALARQVAARTGG